MTKQNKKKKSSVVSYIIILVVAFNLIFPFVGSQIDKIQDRMADSGEAQVENLEIMSVSSFPVSLEDIPAGYGTVEVGDGYQLYQFDVTVKNQGNRSERLRYSPLSLDGVDGYAGMIYEDNDEDSVVEDTRILPKGREVTMTIYGMVSEDTKEVEVGTYLTPDGEKRSYIHQLG